MVTGLLRGLWGLLVGGTGPSVPIETTDVQLDPWGVPTGPVENLDAEVVRLKELAAAVGLVDPRCPADARYCAAVREERDYYRRVKDRHFAELERFNVELTKHATEIAKLKRMLARRAQGKK